MNVAQYNREIVIIPFINAVNIYGLVSTVGINVVVFVAVVPTVDSVAISVAVPAYETIACIRPSVFGRSSVTFEFNVL